MPYKQSLHRRFLVSLVLGPGLACGLTRLISAQLYGVSPRDPLTFGAVAAVLILVALGACYIPARRAAPVDPTEAPRAQ